MNKHNKYRLKPSEVIALDIPKEKQNYIHRYRLKPHQIEKLQALRRDNKFKRLFFDIETSPNVVYAWRIGYNISLQPHDIITERRIISIHYSWEHEDKVHHLTWDSNQCDKAMLTEFIKVINQSDEAIGHNSDRFDEKWIRTRCIYHRIPAMPKYKSLDTLKKAKYGFNFNSNKLDYIAKFLGVGAKVTHSGFDMWKGVLNNDKESLKEMVKYGKGDVVVLKDVYYAMQSYIKQNSHVGVSNGEMKFTCPICGSEDVELYKNEVTTLGTIKRIMYCKKDNHYYPISNSAYMNMLKFRGI